MLNVKRIPHHLWCGYSFFPSNTNNFYFSFSSTDTKTFVPYGYKVLKRNAQLAESEAF